MTRSQRTSEPAPVLPALAERGWRVERIATAADGVWVAPGAGATVDYPDTGHDLLADIEDASAWFGERNRLIADALASDGLPGTLVEIGAGNGFVAAHLRRQGVDAVAVEPVRSAAQLSARRGVPTICGLYEELGLPDGAIEAAGVFDVIEHIEDPQPLLRELHRTLVPGGRLAVTVPAHRFLWSGADDLAGHHRRYRRGDLIAELAAAGFTVRTCHHVFGALVPAVGLLRAVPYRLGQRRGEAREADVGTRQVALFGQSGNAAARAAFAAERALRRRVDLPLGTSLLAIFAC
jgi:SAM-dependent methyltransferase